MPPAAPAADASDGIDVDDGVALADAAPAGGAGGVASGAAAGDVPSFPAITATAAAGGKDEVRRVRVPAHRYTPLKAAWESITAPLVDACKLQVRFNPATRTVEIKVRTAARCVRHSAHSSVVPHPPSRVADVAVHGRPGRAAKRGGLCARLHAGV